MYCIGECLLVGDSGAHLTSNSGRGCAPLMVRYGISPAMGQIELSVMLK